MSPAPGDPGATAPPGGALAKAPTHIAGLDAILGGGLPRGRITAINGPPGSGKTLLGLETLYRGALAGEPGVLVGFEESPAMLREDAATLGWDLAALEHAGRLYLLDARIEPQVVLRGEFTLAGLLAAASGKVQEIGARRVVVDSLEVVLRLFDEHRQVRAEMHALADWMRRSGVTAILTNRPERPAPALAYSALFASLADCLIALDTRVEGQVSTRRLRVVKYRGSDFGRNEYPYVITASGFYLAPITDVGLAHQPLGAAVPSGVASLDTLLGGGFRRASCALLAGLPGTGKTLLASLFARAACGRGEAVLYVSFEESAAALCSNVLSAGIELAPHLDAGALRMLTAMPEAAGAEEHLFRVLREVEDHPPAHLVVDAISACARMGGHQAAYEFLMRLLNFCKARGITVVLVNQTSGTRAHLEISGSGISSMIDTVVFLDYREGSGETNRVVRVLKSRGAAHSNQQREYRISATGIEVLAPYTGEGEVLTGTARQVQEAREALDAERLGADIEQQRRHIERLHAEIEADRVRRETEIAEAEAELEHLEARHRRAQADAERRRSVRGR